jgi:hypothetical protein
MKQRFFTLRAEERGNKDAEKMAKEMAAQGQQAAFGAVCSGAAAL